MPYEIAFQTVFAAAHAIVLPDGSLEPLHGHNWEVHVTVAGAQLDAIETVMDFHDLERIVRSVTGAWHNRSLNDCPPFAAGPAASGAHPHGLAISPTAERVAQQLAIQVAGQLPPAVQLQQVTVSEAPGCTATYRP